MPDAPELDALVAALEAAGVDGFWKLYDLASNADALLPILAAHAGPAARATALRVLLEERIGTLAGDWQRIASDLLDLLAPEAPDGA